MDESDLLKRRDDAAKNHLAARLTAKNRRYETSAPEWDYANALGTVAVLANEDLEAYRPHEGSHVTTPIP